MYRLVCFIIITVISASLLSCDANYLVDSPDPQLVVEGWIENDACPVVILTETVPISENNTYFKDLGKYLVVDARVCISDGTDSVVLTGRYDKGYFPPFIYTTNKMKGVTGKRYSLTVDYKEFHVTAETVIPETPVLNGYSVELFSGKDSLYQINMSFVGYPGEKKYYQFFTRVGNDSKQYLVSRLGSIDDSNIGSCDSVPVYRGSCATETEKNHTYYFKYNDTVSVKLTQIDSVAHNYWYQYSKFEALSSNMFFCASLNLPTNLKGRGIGYWFGYGAADTTIIIKDVI